MSYSEQSTEDERQRHKFDHLQEEKENLQRKLDRAEKALEWYANWDWSDKYVQAIPIEAKKALAEIRGEE